METILQIRLGRNQCSNFESAIAHEWLVTNGIGGFACGTVGGMNTRRYHGLLIAALEPPLARNMLVSSMDVTVRYGSKNYPLFAHEFIDTVEPEGYLHLESFSLENNLPVWRYAFSDVLLEKRIMMKAGENTTYISFHLLRASQPLELSIMPLCTYRDYHGNTQGGWDMGLDEIADGFQIKAFPDAIAYQICCENALWINDPAWYWQFKYRAETLRGLDDSEDLFRPGWFKLDLASGEKATLVLSAGHSSGHSSKTGGRDETLMVKQQLVSKHKALIKDFPQDTPEWILQLILNTDQFIVDRYQNEKPAGKTIIAGYPWFGDWGRDTMIALPGLTLTTGRFELAANILRTFANVISQGMLPNRFPDSGEEAEYNTVDATLWYFNAIDQYWQHSSQHSLKHRNDLTLIAELYPVLDDIVNWHLQGTRYGIKVDPQDGLLFAGEEAVQLTWMDAKVGDWVVTPRTGKAVEVNALWYNALCIMEQFAQQLGDSEGAKKYKKRGGWVKAGFQRFWNDSRACLYDVIDASEIETADNNSCYDARLRPNQLFAVSLPNSPLDATQQKAVVDICARQLLTSHGLRSLARGEPGYVASYQGDQWERDSAYHQGTVWAWLLGSFVDAHYRVYQDTAVARSFLEPLGLHLSEAGMGSISEIFDAEPPFAAHGCFAQAWSVAEVLRAWFACAKK